MLLHGRGTDENDLYPFIDFLDPDRRLLGATVRAPLSLPPGGRHWYAVQRIGYPDPDTFKATYPQLTATVDALLAEHGIPPERALLGGFSQGGVMSYALGLGPERPRPAGVLALSSFIPTVPDIDLDVARAKDLPVLVAHGSHDRVIGVEWGHDARDKLEAAGAQLEYHESPMPHTIDPRLLPEFQDFVARSVPGQ